MKIYVVIYSGVGGWSQGVREVHVYLPDQLDDLDRSTPHSLFVVDLDDEALLPYAMAIVASTEAKHGDSVAQ